MTYQPGALSFMPPCPPRELTCSICGASFTSPNIRKKAWHYCSDACRNSPGAKARRKRMDAASAARRARIQGGLANAAI